jgi:hypothetical protein
MEGMPEPAHEGAPLGEYRGNRTRLPRFAPRLRFRTTASVRARAALTLATDDLRVRGEVPDAGGETTACVEQSSSPRSAAPARASSA